MKQTKYIIFISFFIGALLIAKLLFISNLNTESVNKIKKPSELNFSLSNNLEQNKFDHANSTDLSQPAQLISNQADMNTLETTKNFTSQDKLKWDLFKNILLTKNDNDPHLDKDLLNLSDTLHKALIEKYESIPAENRNERGLVVYLISRDLRLTEDFQFLKKIYQETPCLSLENCKTLASEDPHHDSVNQTTLTYPQQAALYQIEKKLTEDPKRLNEAHFKNEIIQILIQAENYAVPIIQEKARLLRLKFGL